EEQAGEKVVDAQRQRDDVVDVGGIGPAEAGDVFLGYHRVFERVVLVIVFDDRTRQPRAFRNAQPLRQAAGGDVANHHLERNDLHLANELLTHVQAADEVGGDADLG